MAHDDDSVSVTVVTYNSGRFIRRCLESVLEQHYPECEVIVIDNASTDGTADILEQFEDRCTVCYNQENIGFAAAQNQAIDLAQGAWVLTLNPDVLLLPGFIRALVDGGRLDPRIGAVCGKLLTMTPQFEIPAKAVVDSTGIYFNPMLRHLDRGSQQVDNGHYLQYEYVFGATAAAALYRRIMIEDVVPYARGYHVRKVLPGNRRALPPEINMHSVKNRFLMRLKNISGDLYRRNWLSITARDFMVVTWCLVREHTSIRAFWYVARNWRRVLAKRRWIQERRRVDDQYIASWFRYKPVSMQAPRKALIAAPPVFRITGHAASKAKS
jgi:glycosyltransferase involved in cell wall biosynthesis